MKNQESPSCNKSYTSGTSTNIGIFHSMESSSAVIIYPEVLPSEALLILKVALKPPSTKIPHVFQELKSKKVRMLNSLANYILGGNIFSAQDSRQSNYNEILESLPPMSRISQVVVEGDDWILIDRAVEGTPALEESWYVTPPACFTRAGPVNVETSPLENLLIEHPSMSVYRATASPIAPDTPPPTPDATEDRNVEDDVLPTLDPESSGASLQRSSRRRNKKVQQPRRPSIHDGRPANCVCTEKVRIVQLRSAQKVLEKRSTQGLKRGRLERSNKLREVFSVKGKRPRRQDRLRIQNSGANNNRKC